ncbi:hypothetical protein [Granulicella tundricola]|uniref:Uncharacterized protein n=1 Tax=Granulicella tundricola (strain ATCC BAA-1859 / DSM 23138 / MP5ACTX9) TaxID=1198114 RepID=E8X6G9_GRATM|nr:hypothetical protein [Granulicella tundricola]ADW71053.1 hypothetical protein AciX9_4283 [Granulicella tundricola MP5ACTX9]
MRTLGDNSLSVVLELAQAAIATINTFFGALVSSAVIHPPAAMRCRFDRSTTAPNSMHQDLAQVAVAALADPI